MKRIDYGRHFITQEDIDAINEVLCSDHLTQGPKVSEFENKFASYIGSKHAVAVSSGTAALHLSALSLGVKPGDKVIIPTITFSATANCIRYCGGEVVFCDIDPESYLIDLNKARKILEDDRDQSIKGIIPVDFAGMPIDLEECRKLANEFGLWIIEDACHAPGGSFRDSNGIDQHCGNGVYTDLAIFSFHPVKHIATGEGGMITTNNDVLYEKLIRLRSHGITRDPNLFENDLSLAIGLDEPADYFEYPGWYMEMLDLGFNYRITDIQCALGISQLDKVNLGFERRKAIAIKYDLAFEGSIIKSQLCELREVSFRHVYHLYVVKVPDRLGLYNHLRKKEIFAQVHYIPVHYMPYYQNLGWEKGDFPVAEEYYSKCLSIPMYPSLSTDDQELVINEIFKFSK